jgi:KDO2-lipid IV(A) lauroyltransferase
LDFLLLRDAREKTIRHLRIAFGDCRRDEEIRQLAKKVFIQLGCNAAEAMRIPQLIQAGLQNYIRFIGKEHLDCAYARGKGVLCLTGHIGCWELFGAFIASQYPLKVVGAALYDPRLDAILIAERGKAGYSSLPRDASGTRQIIRWMKQGGLLGILIDQDTRVDGEFIDFFGQPAYTPAGPVVIAERTGAALVPLAIYMNEDGTHTVEARAEVQLQNTGNDRQDRIANVEKCSKAVEAFIREHPAQWVWMHERWKTKAPKETSTPV